MAFLYFVSNFEIKILTWLQIYKVNDMNVI
jgi:hypothetical protein